MSATAAADAEPTPADRDAERSTEPEIHVDLDGTVTVDWWVHPSFAFRLQDSAERDHALQQWPVNLVEGTHTTAGLGVLEHHIGPVKLQLGAGVGISTTTDLDGPTGHPKQAPQSPAAIATAHGELELPGRWFLRAGVTASSAAGQTTTTAGISARTEF